MSIYRHSITLVIIAACLLLPGCTHDAGWAAPAPTDTGVESVVAPKGYPIPAPGEISDILLVGEGKTYGDLLPIVAHVDRAGRCQDWFHDGFCLLRVEGEYVNGITTKAMWEGWLDSLFDVELPKIKKALDTAEQALGARPFPLKISTFIPYTSPKQKDFGDVDGDGISEDLSDLQHRLKVLSWYTDEVRRRFNEHDTSGMEFWGFYWTGEGIYDEEDIASIRAAADTVHAKGVKLLWIPWFKAPGTTRLDDLGFDVVTMQPGYAWCMPLRGCLPNEDQLTVAGNISRRSGMGIELEAYGMVHPVLRYNSQMYLEHGSDELDGYQAAAIVNNDSLVVQRTSQSEHPGIFRLYDDLYQFAKGTYKRRGLYQPLKAPVLSGGNADAAALEGLVDGLWNTRGDTDRMRVDLAGADATLTFDLGAGKLVSDVRVHFTGNSDGEVVGPRRVGVALSRSTSGEDFEEVEAIGHVAMQKEHGGGFGILCFEPTLARRMRVSVQAPAGRDVGLDEVLLYPTVQALWGTAYAAPGSEGDGVNLTDGMVGKNELTTWEGGGQVTVSVPEPRYAGSVGVHFCRVEPDGFDPQVEVVGATTAGAVTRQTAGAEAWVIVPVDQIIERLTLKVADAAAGKVAIDEITLLDSESPTVDKAYIIDPLPLEDTGDPGRVKLTDGELSAEAGDGKDVRWFVGNVDTPLRNFCLPEATIVVDLGQIEPVEEVAIQLWGRDDELDPNPFGVNFPRATMVSLSDDGHRWTRGRVFDRSYLNFGKKGEQPGWIRQRLDSSGRFVKIRLGPEGYSMALSEIRIMSGGKNVGLNKPYSLHPQPTGIGTLADNCAKLTNNFMSLAGSVSPWDPVADFTALKDSENSEVTVDLCGVHDIRGARAHFVRASEEGQSTFPKQMRVHASVDGEDWVTLGAVSEHSELSGETGDSRYGHYDTGFMDVLFAPVKARYVRYELTPNGAPIWVDELEVIPVNVN